MIRRAGAGILTVLFLLAAGPHGATLAATAQGQNQQEDQQDQREQGQSASAPAGDDARYSFHRIGDGFVRLDSRTGELAQCGWGTSGWSCKVVPTERADLENKINRLERENAALKKSLLTRGIDLPSGVIAGPPAAPGPVPPANVPDPSRAKEPKAPDSIDLDRAVAFVKHVWRRLVDLVSDLRRDVDRKT